MSPVKCFFNFYFTTARAFSNSITVLPLTGLLGKRGGRRNYRKTFRGGAGNVRILNITDTLGFAKYISTLQQQVFRTGSCLDQELKIQTTNLLPFGYCDKTRKDRLA